MNLKWNEHRYYIDTIALKEQVYFKDSGYHIMNYSYNKKKSVTGLEGVFKYMYDGEEIQHHIMDIQTSIYGGRLFKTSKEFVNEYGFHIQIQAPPALYKQQVSKMKNIMPVKCSMIITIPSLLELYKTDNWANYIVGSSNPDDGAVCVEEYINKDIELDKLNICVWNAKQHSKMVNSLNKELNTTAQALKISDMELSQLDICTNTGECDVSTFYNLLKYVGNYGRKNLKLYHNNIDSFDAEYTTGNYKDREQLVNKVSGYISTKANGLEFRRGSKSSHIVKFYDYTLKSRQEQIRLWMPVYSSLGKKQQVEHLKNYYGTTAEDINKKDSSMRYEVSIRNIVGGNKGVKKLFKDMFADIETDTITIQHLFNKRYSSVVRTTLRRYLYNIFGDVLTEPLEQVGGDSMNKWDLVKEEQFQKGLQIMAVLQLMEGDNAMSLAEIKKKCIESGANYESVRRLFKLIKDKGYASNWNSDRIVAMNVMKEIYEGLDKVK